MSDNICRVLIDQRVNIMNEQVSNTTSFSATSPYVPTKRSKIVPLNFHPELSIHPEEFCAGTYTPLRNERGTR